MLCGEAPQLHVDYPRVAQAAPTTRASLIRAGRDFIVILHCLCSLLFINRMTFANLNAVISTAPETFLIEEAQTLDAERRKSGPRSKLHGMPILLKV